MGKDETGDEGGAAVQARPPVAPTTDAGTAAGRTVRALADTIMAQLGEKGPAVTCAYGYADAVDGLVRAVEAGDTREAATLAAVLRG